MSREWKPGDVAKTRAGGRVFRSSRQGRDSWILYDGFALDLGYEPSPLVVIDAEDAEQMRALGNAWDELADKHAELTDEPMTLSALRMQHALREFANPTPRIEEPLERWSRVFDGEGREWCRTEWDGGLDKPWQHDGTHAHWSALSKHHGPVTLSPCVPS